MPFPVFKTEFNFQWANRRLIAIAACLLCAGATAAAAEARAVFAGGCFWCMEPPYDKQEGVRSTVSGYAGGDKKNPSYEEVSAGGTGHLEVVEITYDPAKVSYARLLEIYWTNVDPLDGGGQFCDRGASYRPAIFYLDEDQRERAERSKEEVAKLFDQPVQVEIRKLDRFWPAEDYHQNYYQEHSLRYKFYRWKCGRDDRLEELWEGVELELRKR